MADMHFDDDLAQRLPLPLAQLYRRACNAKTARERHNTAYYLWEVSLKLLGAVAVSAYAERKHDDDAITERLRNLARPAVGHWWEFVRLLTPILADADDFAPGFRPVRELLFGKMPDELPRLKALDGVLLESLSGGKRAGKVGDVFERLVAYRNREIGHGAAGQKSQAHYERLGNTLLLGLAELLGRLDVLAGHRLLYLAEVRGRRDGSWIIERNDLSRAGVCRAESLVLPADAADQLPRAEQLYLQPAANPSAPPRLLHPLVLFDAEAEEVLFLNARAGKTKVAYLAYTSGRIVERADLAGERRELLRRVLDVPDDAVHLDNWAVKSAAEDQSDYEVAPEGRTLGEFELLSKLGQGGMGIVYRARQPSLNRQVALKCLFRTGDPKAEARFAREISALGRVEHPHLVKIHASGSDGEQWFYAMELIDGTTLAGVCEHLQARGSSAGDLDLPTWRETVSTACEQARKSEQSLSDASDPPRAGSPHPAPGAVARSLDRATTGRNYVARVVELVRQIADAAQALHDKRIIHRDIKPGNIMLSADGSTAVLMDLGLAQIADEVEGRLTRTRQFVGTLRYASPEQVLAVDRLQPTSDVYSLGATLWELLTLRPIYDATDQTPTPQVMQRIQVDDPDRIRTHNRAVPRDVEAIVEKCLQKDPRKRYPTARELSEELQRFLDGKPVRARRAGSIERAVKWAKRRPTIAALWALSVLAFVGFITVGIVFAVQADQRAATEERLRKEADAKAEEAKKNETLAKQNEVKARDALAEAQKQRKIANDNWNRAEWKVYAGNIALAQVAWQENNVPLMYHYLDACRKDFRDWEHDHVVTLLHEGRRTFRGHENVVRSVACSLDGKWIVSGSADKTVKVWDTTSGQAILTLKGHTASVSSVAFSGDGKRIVSGSNDSTAKVWDATSGQEVFTCEGHTELVLSVAFSHDGQRIVSSSLDRTVRVWDATSGKGTLLVEGDTFRVNSVAYSRDDKQIVGGTMTIAKPGEVKLWDATSGQEIRTLKGHTDAVNSVAFSGDGKRIVSGSRDGTVKVWDATSGQEEVTLKGHTNSVFSATFSGDGKRIASGSWDSTVKVWDTASGQETITLKGHTNEVTSVAFSGDSKRIVSAGYDMTVRVWDASRRQKPREAPNPAAPRLGVR